MAAEATDGASTGGADAGARARTRAADRYALDTSRPGRGAATRDLAVRVALPAAGLLALLTGLGALIVGPWRDLPGETAVNRWFVERRTPGLTSLALAGSQIGQTETVIGLCLVLIAVTWWRTRQWWLAAVPGIAVATQAVVFLVSSAVVGRERPHVELLERAPPTSSFPSGHTGASVALYVTAALLARRLATTWARVVLVVLACALPLFVATARLYLGMHHLTDVLAGALNGAVCVWLAWHWVRRSPGGRSGHTRAWRARANE